MSAPARGLAFRVLPLLLVAALVGAGWWAGRRSAWVEIEGAIAARDTAATLGSTVAALHANESERLGEIRAALAQAYLDPSEALAGLDDYVWDVPTVPSPFVGAAPAPGRHANATINAQQFRHAGPVVMPKPEGTLRIFVTGGSTAFGSGAPDDARTISGYLEGLFRERHPETAVEVVNAACPAWASTHERIWIENRIAVLDPDLVIAFTGNNDVHWGALGRDVTWFRSIAEDHYWHLLDRLHVLSGRGSLVDVTTASGFRVRPPVVAQRLVRNLRLARRALPARTRFVFALQPNLVVTQKELTPRERDRARRSEELEPGSSAYFSAAYAQFRRRMHDLAADGIRAVDLSTAFDQYGPDREIFIDRYHFGDRGNRIVAEALLRAADRALAGEE